MKDDVLLTKYKTLIFLSLEAQENNDIEQEERAIDALDVVWAKMSNEQRRLADKINREAIAWFNTRMHIAVQLDLDCKIQSVGSLSQTSNVRIHSLTVGSSDARFGRMVVDWEGLPSDPWTTSSGGFFSDIAAMA